MTNDEDAAAGVIPGLKKISMKENANQDLFTNSVYGSRFAAEDLPTHEMPENEMPKEVAYRMIKDDLSLDGNPMLKYAVVNGFREQY